MKHSVLLLALFIYINSAKSQNASWYLKQVEKSNDKIKSGEYHLMSEIKFIEQKDTTTSNVDITFLHKPTLTLASINNGKTMTIYDTSSYRKILTLLTAL